MKGQCDGTEQFSREQTHAFLLIDATNCAFEMVSALKVKVPIVIGGVVLKYAVKSPTILPNTRNIKGMAIPDARALKKHIPIITKSYDVPNLRTRYEQSA